MLALDEPLDTRDLERLLCHALRALRVACIQDAPNQLATLSRAADFCDRAERGIEALKSQIEHDHPGTMIDNETEGGEHG